jgi:large subunit ribosomal protein L23
MTMAGLFDKIKKRAGLRGKSDADTAEAELTKPAVAPKKKAEPKAEAKRLDAPKIEKKEKNLQTAAYRILLKPVVSEKASVAESNNTYIFHIVPTATKTDVKQAVQKIYGVTPAKVRIINALGKSTRTRNGLAKRGDWKKALVTLPAGQTIGIHEGV